MTAQKSIVDRIEINLTIDTDAGVHVHNIDSDDYASNEEMVIAVLEILNEYTDLEDIVSAVKIVPPSGSRPANVKIPLPSSPASIRPKAHPMKGTQNPRHAHVNLPRPLRDGAR